MIRGPRRTCVACREVRMKHELIRLVRCADGAVLVDAGGRAPGRGAYVCRGGGCAARLVKGGRLNQAFRRPTRIEAAWLAAVQAIEESREREASVIEVRTMGQSVTSSRR